MGNTKQEQFDGMPEGLDFQGLPVEELLVGVVSASALKSTEPLEMDDEVELVFRGKVDRVEGVRKVRGQRQGGRTYVRQRAVVRVDELVKVAKIGKYVPNSVDEAEA